MTEKPDPPQHIVDRQRYLGKRITAGFDLKRPEDQKPAGYHHHGRDPGRSAVAIGRNHRRDREPSEEQAKSKQKVRTG